MPQVPPETLTPFVFSDPAGKRWPRLRLILLIAGVLLFLGTVLFVQTLFVTPQMRVPFSLRQLKGQLKALQKENPAGQDKRQKDSSAQHRRHRRGPERNRRTTKCGLHFTLMAIRTAMRLSSCMRGRSRMFAQN